MFRQKNLLKYLLLLLLALGSLPLAQASAPSRRTPLLKRWKPRCHALKGKITQRLPVARRLGKKSHQPWRSSHARRCYAPLLTTAPPPPSHRRGRFHHWNARPNRRLALTMLLGSSLGGTAYWLQSNPVTARGYDDGLYSIVAFQTTLQAFTEPDLDTLDPLACTALHQAATHLLFEIQAKIIQCRALSKATGYPLFKPDFQAYRKVRCETEALIRKLCARHDDLPKIGDMQTLEDAFFDKEGKEEEQTLGSCLIGFCKGGGEATTLFERLALHYEAEIGLTPKGNSFFEFGNKKVVLYTSKTGLPTISVNIDKGQHILKIRVKPHENL